MGKRNPLRRGLFAGSAAVVLAATQLAAQDGGMPVVAGGPPAQVIRDERLLVSSRTIAAVPAPDYAGGRGRRWLIPVAGAVAGGALAWLFWEDDCQDCMFTIPTTVRGAAMGGGLGLLVALSF